MTVMPSLQELAIQREQNACKSRDILAIGRGGLMSLCFGRNLEIICLNISDGLKRKEI